MPVLQTERRRVLLAISQLALAIPLVSCSQEPAAGEETAGDSDLELLASLAFDLFPYPELPATLYVQVGEHLLQSGNPLLSEGLAQIRQQVSQLPWKEVSEDSRIGILTAMQDTAFFAALRAGTLEVLYRSPEVFELVGYGGPALEKGGYLNRGFDDIDWLPQQR